jgi:hypothetical protein
MLGFDLYIPLEPLELVRPVVQLPLEGVAVAAEEVVEALPERQAHRVS